MVVGWLGIFFFKCYFTSTETIRLTVGTWSPGRPPRPEHSSWALRGVLMIAFIQQYSPFSTLEGIDDRFYTAVFFILHSRGYWWSLLYSSILHSPLSRVLMIAFIQQYSPFSTLEGIDDRFYTAVFSILHSRGYWWSLLYSSILHSPLSRVLMIAFIQQYSPFSTLEGIDDRFYTAVFSILHSRGYWWSLLYSSILHSPLSRVLMIAFIQQYSPFSTLEGIDDRFYTAVFSILHSRGYWWSLLYSSILHSPLSRVLMIAFIQQYSPFSTLEQTHCAFVAYDSKWVTVAFYSAFWMSTEVVYLHLVLVVSWLVPYGSATVSARSVHIAQPCTICHVTSGRSRLAQAGRFGPLKVIHTLPLLLWLWVFYWVRINLYDAWGPTWKLS